MLKIAYSPIYHHPLPPGHRFPMVKYSLIPEQLLYEGTCSEDNFFTPEKLSEKQILRTHTAEYWEKLKTNSLTRQEERKTGFPLTPKLVEREITICQGTIDNAKHALEHGISMNIAGGTHHAYANSGEGFCLLNDICLASHWLLDNNLAKQILVVDLDVHQGNGTAKIMENESRVFTFSMHGEKNYPMHKESSDLDIELPDGTEDSLYLQTLENNLPRLIDEVQPDFIFFQSGVDILATDKLGRLGLSMDGCKQRDKFVLESCKQNNIPVAVNIGGGYSHKLSDIVDAHANTFRLAQEIYF
ncbi:deacetylase, histone deacetylase/acetoin utilization protein [Owenweeksia hongkongensis DSM 17368]|uniref:Deacetylase, histone deacetylase/acetoin utilization protein n=1 Tax=Owenweeksia hongkongensis (strain DSM 17368 / CIP 108786 / JCM 12287 / NRRL B-23963 / UST20020801) TaxID=926562 RepID=G8R213_OWEHD|nr:histone deacetylase [Owenweeksia hongkongensis]AEV33963.1 deacetylase, histone deacetylase/acetoin utilization protein [Owenweeksia hongkongensis DSM 17368]